MSVNHKRQTFVGETGLRTGVAKKTSKKVFFSYGYPGAKMLCGPGVGLKWPVKAPKW